LYDAVKTEDFSPNLSNPFDSRILECSLVEESKRFERFSSELKVNYDTAMRRIMAQYGIETEFEVWSTFVLGHNFMCRDYKLHEDLGKVASGLRSGIQEQCYKHLGGKRDFGHVAPLAVAMYRITHEEVQDALATLRGENAYDDQDEAQGLPDEHEMEISRLPFISFPWVFEPVLCKIVSSPDDELHNALAEAQAIDTRKAQPKFFTHAEVMKMVGRAERTGFKAQPDRDEVGTTDAELGHRELHHFGDLDLYENDLYQETPGSGSSSARKEDRKRDGDEDPDVIVPVNDGKPSTIDQCSVLTNRHKEDIKEATEGKATDEDEDDGDVHIIEMEGDVKPSAIDELIALLGNDYDADDEDDW
jgi:RNA-dependent RNA polymerase